MKLTAKWRRLAARGYAFIDYDGWNVSKGGSLIAKDLASLESAIQWAWEHDGNEYWKKVEPEKENQPK